MDQETFENEKRALEIQKLKDEKKRMPWKTRQRMVIGINAFIASMLLFLFAAAEPELIKSLENITLALIGWVATLDMAFFGFKGLAESENWGKFLGKNKNKE